MGSSSPRRHGVDADAGPERRNEAGERAGRGQEVARGILGVQPHLDRVAAKLGSAGRGQALAGRDSKLPLGEVDAGKELGDGVLDLEAGVHLDEVEPIRGEEELERPGAAVAEGLAGARGRGFHLGAELGGDSGDGPSSTSFWWRRWTEQSRSPRVSTEP